MTMGVCHASYMGVSYMMVLRLPNVKGGYKAKKEPTKDYILYQKDRRIFSFASGNYKNNSDCTKVETNVNVSKKNGKNRKNSSFMNRFTGFFKPKKNNKKNNSSGKIELQPMNLKNSNLNVQKEEKQGVFSKCSIL